MMNRTISRLLASALVMSSAFAASASETNVTYVNMMSFRHRVQTAQQLRFVAEMPKKDRIGGSLQLMPFYRRSYHKLEWGKGLGIEHKNEFSTDGGVVSGALSTFNLSFSAGDWVSTVKVTPEHYAFGANLNYEQSLSELYDGLYLFANTAILQDNRRDNLDVSGTDAASVKPYLVKTSGVKGLYSETSWESKAGVEDPELGIGYVLVNEDAGNFSLNIAASIPTGTEPTCELVNEPLVGSKHFRLGAGLRGALNIWEGKEGDDKALKAFFEVNYRYAFEHSMCAIPRLTGLGATLSNHNWGHTYRTAAGATSATVASKYASNVKVKPGNEVDGYAGLLFSSCNFTGALGYMLTFRQSHTPVAGDAFVSYNIKSGVNGTSDVALAKENLDWKREQLVVHTFCANAGMVMKDWEYPCHFSLGASIDVAHKKQITPETWQINGTVGVSF